MDYNPPYLPYAAEALSPYMGKRLRRLRSWGNSEVFARLSFYDVQRDLKGENVLMARKMNRTKIEQNSDKTTSKTLTTWLNYRLTPGDVPVVLEDAQDQAALANRLALLFVSGVDFSIRYVPERKNFSAFVISQPDEKGIRIGISAFGGDIFEALACVLFKADLYRDSPESFAASGGGSTIG